MIKRSQFVVLLVAAMLLARAGSVSADGSTKADAKAQPTVPAMEALRGLIGTWDPVGAAEKDMPHGSLVFKSTAAGSALMETMFPDSDHEMVNMYTLAGDNVLCTHYCAMGNQPHMKLKSMEKNVLTIEFVDAGNLKSRDEPHMDALQITIDGDKLTEKWSFCKEAKVVSSHTFDFARHK